MLTVVILISCVIYVRTNGDVIEASSFYKHVLNTCLTLTLNGPAPDKVKKLS